MAGQTPARIATAAAEGTTPRHESFSATLARHNLELTRGETHTLQINVGLLCNQACRHCHLEAGPGRKEMMSEGTLNEVVAFAHRGGFQVIDITGGTPELHPDLPRTIEIFPSVAPKVMLRCNLTGISENGRGSLIDLCKANRIALVVSLPSLNRKQAESLRGSGIFDRSIEALRALNAAGYGQPDSGLEISLVSNPAGAFLPPSQAQVEGRFRRDLHRRWGIVFNHLYTFGNVPLGRFRRWLRETGNLSSYTRKLASSFNPCTVDQLMCRTLVSVSWDGFLYDCDFNLAVGLSMAERRTHVSEMAGPPRPGSPIAVSDHCFACTAGSGFT